VCSRVCTLSQYRTKLLLLSHNFSNVMINNTSTDEAHYARGHVPNGKKGKTVNKDAKSNTAVIAVLTARLDAMGVAKDNTGQETDEGTSNL
jgi:hypothetical protein